MLVYMTIHSIIHTKESRRAYTMYYNVCVWGTIRIIGEVWWGDGINVEGHWWKDGDAWRSTTHLYIHHKRLFLCYGTQGI